ncbi:tubulin monoglutamylase TTLL4-like [Athalia rosae]|uniref:tubulin monoglutamylase TTLL4-like n=1 Tax=Athalia rosae TaxID=37344 RepID=UPI002034452D|nr:tubulin monoglutamylase TTLL4-like [Athalia rosae]
MDVISYNHHGIVHRPTKIGNGKAVGNGVSEDPDYTVEDDKNQIFHVSKRPLCLTGEMGAGGDKTNKIPLRKSLFPHVAPYVIFHSYENRGVCLPPEVTKHLKWRLSTITPLLVRRTLVNSGFRLVKKSPEWCGTWGKHMKSMAFKSLRESQKINHFPGTFQIGRKDRLWRNLSRMMIKHGKKEFGFVPRTYVLPQDLRGFRQVWEKTGGKEKWIVKPPASARGTGIRVVHRWSQIPKKKPVIVQQYLSKPMLIGGAKFDLRLYVLVTSFNPLRVYIYPDGLVRFASVKYRDDINYLSDRFMHLTNYSINKTSSTYTSNDSVDSCTGHKWTIKSLWSYLKEKENVDVAKIWASVKDIVVKTMISAESSINSLTRANVSSRYCCYELFGVDIILDENLKPWLLEVNISPSLQSSSPLDIAVKGPLIKTVFNVVGYQVPSSVPARDVEELTKKYELDTLCLDLRLHHIGLGQMEKNKQNLYCHQRKREDYLEEIIEDLTPDDVRHLLAYEDEITQLDCFERIFPTKNTHEYFQFFDCQRYYNALFDAWETAYGDNRAKGIARLQRLCQTKFHLTQGAKFSPV